MSENNIEKQEEPTPYERFEELARKVMTTPKAEVEKVEAEVKALKSKRKKRLKL